MPDTRSTLNRLFKAMNELSCNGFIDKKIYEKENGVSYKTVERDINFLKKYFSLSVEKNKIILRPDSLNPKYFDTILDQLNKLRINNDFFLFYIFAKSMVESKYFFPPIKTESNVVADNNFENIIKILQELVRFDYKDISGKLEYYMSDHYKESSRSVFRGYIDKIIKSLLSKKLIRFSYDNGFSEIYTVSAQPLKLINYNGEWFIIAYVVKTDKKDHPQVNITRTYNLSFISPMNLTEESFPDEIVESCIEFKNSFGFFIDKDIKKAVIKFHGKSTVRQVENVEWVKDQKLCYGNNKESCSFELNYPELGRHELISKVLSFGENAEIISPPELRKEWKTKIKKMFSKYSK